LCIIQNSSTFSDSYLCNLGSGMYRTHIPLFIEVLVVGANTSDLNITSLPSQMLKHCFVVLIVATLCYCVFQQQQTLVDSEKEYMGYMKDIWLDLLLPVVDSSFDIQFPGVSTFFTYDIPFVSKAIIVNGFDTFASEPNRDRMLKAYTSYAASHNRLVEHLQTNKKVIEERTQKPFPSVFSLQDLMKRPFNRIRAYNQVIRAAVLDRQLASELTREKITELGNSLQFVNDLLNLIDAKLNSKLSSGTGKTLGYYGAGPYHRYDDPYANRNRYNRYNHYYRRDDNDW
jgi:hypothetical protein